MLPMKRDDGPFQHQKKRALSLIDTHCVEYAVDTVSGNAVLGIGADLHIVETNVIRDKPSSGKDDTNKS